MASLRRKQLLHLRSHNPRSPNTELPKLHCKAMAWDHAVLGCPLFWSAHQYLARAPTAKDRSSDAVPLCDGVLWCVDPNGIFVTSQVCERSVYGLSKFGRMELDFSVVLCRIHHSLGFVHW